MTGVAFRQLSFKARLAAVQLEMELRVLKWSVGTNVGMVEK
jgi:hypothetical protein